MKKNLFGTLIRWIKSLFKKNVPLVEVIEESKPDYVPVNVISVKEGKYKHRGRLVWDSKRKGTYIRAIHGELK